MEKDRGTFGVDFLDAEKMRLVTDQRYEFDFKSSSLTDKLKWAANAADPTARIATWIALISGSIGILLGLAGLIVGILALCN
jgi:hypothetical protein